MEGMRFPISILTFAVAVLALLPPPAVAGTYDVTACFGPENASWTPFKPGPGVVPYVSCPGGIDAERGVAGEGLYVRNVLGAGMASPGAAAGWRFDAPPGTTITGIAFDGRLLRNPGWHAGLQDAATERWLWCGTECSTSANHWVHDEVRGLSTTRLAALVRCVSAYCRRDRLQAFVGLCNIRVTLDDPAPPALGPLAGVGDGWVGGRLDVAAEASDASGLRAERIEVDGRVVADAGGAWSWVERDVLVDNTPPPEAVAALEGGAGWSPARERALRVTLPGDQVAPIVRARLTVCAAGGRCDAPVPAAIADG